MMNTNEMQIFTVIHPTIEHAQEVTDLVALCDIEAIGEPDITLTDTLDMWSTIQLETNAWLVLSSNNQIVGYGFIEETGSNRMDTCIFVHPQFKNQGIGSLLLTKVEERAFQLIENKNGEQRLMNQVAFSNELAKELLTKRDYQFTRLYERMKIHLTETPQPSIFPESFQIKAFRVNQDEETLFQVYDETFQDSWGYTKKDFATWIQQRKGDHYDPALWYIVWEGSTPVAFLMSRMHDDGLFVDLVGVRRSWRKMGLGKALLLHVFNEAYQRGQNTILLYVDTDSLTNANRVYQQVGMKPDSQTALYMKQLK
jgi:mycothiol synthase